MNNEASERLEFERFTDGGLGTTPSPEEIVIRERIRAAWEDYRQRLHKEMADHEVKAREAMMLDFLEIADNLERATAASHEGGTRSLKSVQDGIDVVLRLFQTKLDRYGVTAIVAEGERFDPRIHHAVSQSTSTDTTPGTVLQEVQKGYWMAGRLLRPASVVVASAPARLTESDTSDGGESMDGAEDDPQEALEDGAKDGADSHAYQRNRR